MSLLDMLRHAVPGAMAARVGYVHGQQARDAGRAARHDRAAKEAAAAAKETAAAQRQSVLDQMASELHKANLEKIGAETERLKRPPEPERTPAPTSRQTADGIEEWDSTNKRWVPTGKKPYRAPVRPLASESLAAKERSAKQETKDALAGVNRQIDDTRARMSAEERNLPNLSSVYPRATAADSAQHRKSSKLIDGMKQRLDSLTGVSDSLNAEVQRPGSRRPAPSPAAAGGGRGGGGAATRPQVAPIDALLSDAQVLEAMRAGAKNEQAVRDYWTKKGIKKP